MRAVRQRHRLQLSRVYGRPRRLAVPDGRGSVDRSHQHETDHGGGHPGPEGSGPYGDAGVDQLGGAMSDQRGVTILEALVASVVVAFAGLALTSFYLAMVNSFAWAHSETVLQRQGSLVLDVIGRQSRRASNVAAGCAPAGSVGDSLQVTVAAPLSGA